MNTTKIILTVVHKTKTLYSYSYSVGFSTRDVHTYVGHIFCRFRHTYLYRYVLSKIIDIADLGSGDRFDASALSTSCRTIV